MPYITVKNEESLRDLLHRTYDVDANASPKERKDAEDAFVVANPRLKDPGALKEGMIIKVPEIKSDKLRPRIPQARPDGVEALVNALLTALRQTARRLEEAAAANVAVANDTLVLHKDAGITRILADDKELQAEVDEASKRAKTLIDSARPNAEIRQNFFAEMEKEITARFKA